jgi:Protease subunit of ATP-dependent Clp proteases
MAKREADAIGNFFQYGVDIASRTLYVGSHADFEQTEGGTDYLLANYAVKGLHLLDQTPGEITILMNNPGGDEYHGMAIYDAIELCTNHVKCVGIGMVMSMGSWIIQAADERLMTRNSTMLLHYGTWSYDGHAKDFTRSSAESDRQRGMMEECYLGRIRQKHPKYPLSRIKKLLLFDSWLSAQDALDLGLIDRILEPK